MPSTSGTPATTSAPNAAARMISISTTEMRSAFFESFAS
jgi:hypothetical protein